MKIFLDTADIGEIRRAAEAGLIDGVTTNPSLMAKVGADREPAELFLEICEAVDGPVSAEVVALDAEGMIEQGPAPREDSRQHRDQDPAHRGRTSRLPYADERRHSRERDALFFAHPGPPRREGREPRTSPRSSGGSTMLRGTEWN